MEIAYDMTRLFERRNAPSPSGIDRVDLRFALFARDSGRVWRGLVQRDYGAEWLDADQAHQLLDYLSIQWLGQPGSASCPQGLPGWERESFASLLEKCRGLSLKERVAGRPFLTWPAFACPRLAQALFGCRKRTGSAKIEEPAGASVYWNIGHNYRFRAAADQIAGVWRGRALLFLHDVIPLQHPEFCPPRSVAHFRRFCRWAADLQGQLLFSSQTALEGARSLQDRGRPLFPAQALTFSQLPLPVEELFQPSSKVDTSKRPAEVYFLIVGDWQPRRNFELLLEVWERLASPPKLVWVDPGRRKPPRALARRIRQLEQAGAWQRLTAVSDAKLLELYRGSRALLFPSLAEGWGLPLAEALAVGTPVIASDIPICREVGGEAPQYLSPEDAGAWQRAIEACYLRIQDSEVRQSKSTL